MTNVDDAIARAETDPLDNLNEGLDDRGILAAEVRRLRLGQEQAAVVLNDLTDVVVDLREGNERLRTEVLNLRHELDFQVTTSEEEVRQLREQLASERSDHQMEMREAGRDMRDLESDLRRAEQHVEELRSGW